MISSTLPGVDAAFTKGGAGGRQRDRFLPGHDPGVFLQPNFGRHPSDSPRKATTWRNRDRPR